MIHLSGAEAVRSTRPISLPRVATVWPEISENGQDVIVRRWGSTASMGNLITFASADTDDVAELLEDLAEAIRTLARREPKSTDQRAGRR